MKRMPPVPELTGLDLSPFTHPLGYPGVPVPGSCVVTGSWLYPVDAIAGAPVAEWSVRHDGGPASKGAVTVDMLLLTAGATPMAGRRPVLAIGSNASPGQLARKYGSTWRRIAIPITRVRVRGVGVAHSAHVSVPGYIPYVPIRVPSERPVELHVLWLDAVLLERLDHTEPNYVRLDLPGTAQLESGVTLPEVAVYRGRWGALRLACDQPTLPATTQQAVYAALGRLGWFRRLAPELDAGGPAAVAAALALDAARRDLIRHELTARDLAAGDLLDG